MCVRNRTICTNLQSSLCHPPHTSRREKKESLTQHAAPLCISLQDIARHLPRLQLTAVISRRGTKVDAAPPSFSFINGSSKKIAGCSCPRCRFQQKSMMQLPCLCWSDHRFQQKNCWMEQNQHMVPAKIPLFPATPLLVVTPCTAGCSSPQSWLQLPGVPIPANGGVPSRPSRYQFQQKKCQLQQGRMPVPAFGHRGCSSGPSRFQHPMPPHGSKTSSTLQQHPLPYVALAEPVAARRRAGSNIYPLIRAPRVSLLFHSHPHT